MQDVELGPGFRGRGQCQFWTTLTIVVGLVANGSRQTLHNENAESSSDPDAHEALIDDVYRKYVHMVLYARKGAGTWSDDDELCCFVVYLHEPAVICINDEPHGWSVARTRRSFRPGEQLEFADLESDQVPRPEHRPPHFSAAWTPGGWRAEFDLSRPHPASSELFATAAEFLAAAEQAHRTGALRAFVENAFHAAESLVKLELLSYPVLAAELEASRKHPHVQSVYDLWLRLGNTDPRFPSLLRELSDLRASATYVNKPFTLDQEAASKQLQTLRELAEHAQSFVRSTKGRTINLIATRPIDAGELVSEPDVTIRPARRPRSRSDGV
jgi:hypothetical protein